MRALASLVKRLPFFAPMAPVPNPQYVQLRNARGGWGLFCDIFLASLTVGCNVTALAKLARKCKLIECLDTAPPLSIAQIARVLRHVNLGAQGAVLALTQARAESLVRLVQNVDEDTEEHSKNGVLALDSVLGSMLGSELVESLLDYGLAAGLAQAFQDFCDSTPKQASLEDTTMTTATRNFIRGLERPSDYDRSKFTSLLVENKLLTHIAQWQAKLTETDAAPHCLVQLIFESLDGVEHEHIGLLLANMACVVDYIVAIDMLEARHKPFKRIFISSEKDSEMDHHHPFNKKGTHAIAHLAQLAEYLVAECPPTDAVRILLSELVDFYGKMRLEYFSKLNGDSSMAEAQVIESIFGSWISIPFQLTQVRLHFETHSTNALPGHIVLLVRAVQDLIVAVFANEIFDGKPFLASWGLAWTVVHPRLWSSLEGISFLAKEVRAVQTAKACDALSLALHACFTIEDVCRGRDFLLQLDEWPSVTDAFLGLYSTRPEGTTTFISEEKASLNFLRWCAVFRVKDLGITFSSATTSTLSALRLHRIMVAVRGVPDITCFIGSSAVDSLWVLYEQRGLAPTQSQLDAYLFPFLASTLRTITSSGACMECRLISAIVAIFNVSKSPSGVATLSPELIAALHDFIGHFFSTVGCIEEASLLPAKEGSVAMFCALEEAVVLRSCALCLNQFLANFLPTPAIAAIAILMASFGAALRRNLYSFDEKCKNNTMFYPPEDPIHTPLECEITPSRFLGIGAYNGRFHLAGIATRQPLQWEQSSWMVPLKLLLKKNVKLLHMQAELDQFVAHPSSKIVLAALKKVIHQLELTATPIRFIPFPILYPSDGVLFRGLGDRDGSKRSFEAVLDFLVRGFSAADLSTSNPFGQSASKNGLLFMTHSVETAGDYLSKEFTDGAFVVLNAHVVNNSLMYKASRLEKESVLQLALYGITLAALEMLILPGAYEADLRTIFSTGEADVGKLNLRHPDFERLSAMQLRDIAATLRTHVGINGETQTLMARIVFFRTEDFERSNLSTFVSNLCTDRKKVVIHGCGSFMLEHTMSKVLRSWDQQDASGENAQWLQEICRLAPSCTSLIEANVHMPATLCAIFAKLNGADFAATFDLLGAFLPRLVWLQDIITRKSVISSEAFFDVWSGSGLILAGRYQEVLKRCVHSDSMTYVSFFS
jgi:hypothetical protein